MYQKTYTTDSLPLKRYLNTGQRSKYYAMETHEGIISKTDYEKVQNLLAKKSICSGIFCFSDLFGMTSIVLCTVGADSISTRGALPLLQTSRVAGEH